MVHRCPVPLNSQFCKAFAAFHWNIFLSTYGPFKKNPFAKRLLKQKSIQFFWDISQIQFAKWCVQWNKGIQGDSLLDLDREIPLTI